MLYSLLILSLLSILAGMYMGYKMASIGQSQSSYMPMYAPIGPQGALQPIPQSAYPSNHPVSQMSIPQYHAYINQYPASMPFSLVSDLQDLGSQLAPDVTSALIPDAVIEKEMLKETSSDPFQ